MEQGKKADSFISITDLWRLCIAQWRWFVVSVLVCLLFAVNYLLTTPYLYKREAAIMVREDNPGINYSDRRTKEFSEIDFVNQKVKSTNIVRHIMSLDVLMEVARRLDSIGDEGAIFHMAEAIQSRLEVEMDNDKSTIVNLTYKDFSTQEAERVLTLIIQVYNDKLNEEKYLATKNTSKFIDSRLKFLERDLDIVDDSISVFKSRYGITDLEHVSDIYLQQQRQADVELLNLTNQKTMAEYIRDLLKDKSASRKLLLVNSGIKNTAIESQITLYNSLLLQLQNHLDYTSSQNPLIINQERDLNKLRKDILTNIDNHIRTIDIQLQAMTGYHGEAESKITSNPAQAKYLVSIEREQKVKEGLYVYLLQKKEENEISIANKTTNVQIIDIPHGGGKPVSPKRLQVLIAAMLMGFLIPVTFIFLRATLDETVRDRFDIECYSDIPFLGEVPFSGKKRSLFTTLLEQIGIGQKNNKDDIVVGYDKQDPSNEAFRILRTNLEFIAEDLVRDDASKQGIVYLIKSTQIGAGKTYISMNLAITMAIGNKHVLFIDCDLRDISASRRWKTRNLGLTDYLSGKCDDFKQLLFRLGKYPTLDILPSGNAPTNPTELLRSQKFEQLITTVRSIYDVIVIDSPSAGMLADADIIGKHVDCKLFIVRAGLFRRNNLDDLKPVHHDDKQQYVILNGVSIDSRYGFAYAHKYDRSEKITKSWTSKLKKLLN